MQTIGIAASVVDDLGAPLHHGSYCATMSTVSYRRGSSRETNDDTEDSERVQIDTDFIELADMDAQIHTV